MKVAPDTSTPIIVKVQISDIGTGGRHVLVYNEERNLTLEQPATKQQCRCFKYKGGLFKKFYFATIKDGRLQIDVSNVAPWQDW